MNTYKKTKARLDFWFKRFIRLRDSTDGIGQCISCGAFKMFGTEQWQAGHYIKSTYLALRWDEKNVNGQCKKCNHYLSGNEANYSIGLKQKYGESVIDYLHMKKHNKTAYDINIMNILIREYKDKCKQLEQNNG